MPTNKHKVQVSYNGIYEQKKVCKDLFKKPRIVVAGWLLEWKGYDVFVEAMEKIAPSLPEWEFVIAGKPAADAVGSVEYAKSLQERIDSSKYRDKFVMHGGYKSLDEIICCSEHCIFVQPSLKPDPLPTVILEASNFSVPIVASSLGGSKEIIDDKESGELILPNSDEIAKMVLELAKILNYVINMVILLGLTVLVDFLWINM
ncbi:glycosyltransferase family 4 protein [Ectobacillus funiculus]